MSKLLQFVVVRFLLVVPTLLILLSIVFLILRIIPGDPIAAMVGMKAPPEVIEALRAEAGLNKPLYVQYVEYLKGVFTGDLGRSLIWGKRPVIAEIMDHLPATIELAIVAFAISVIIGLGTGLLASHYGGRFDSGMRLYSMAAYALFIPLIGVLLQLVFGVWLRVFPIGGRLSPGVEPPKLCIGGGCLSTGLYLFDSIISGNLEVFLDALKHIALPALTLGIVLSGTYTRLIRNNIEYVKLMEFIQAYRAIGYSRFYITLKAFRAAIIPTITMMGLQFALLLQGAVLTETTFSWPGLGTFLVERIIYLDYTSVQGAVVIFAVLTAVINAIVDIIYAIVDPRVRY